MSQDEFYKYIETPEFKELLANYENAWSSGELGYIEADDLIDLAEYYHMQGDFDMAEGTADYCLELFPNDDPALLFLTRMALVDRGNLHKAKAYFSRVQDVDNNLEAVYVKAELMICEGKGEEADAFLRKKYKDFSGSQGGGPSDNDSYGDSDDEEDDGEVNMPLDIAMLYSDHDMLVLADQWMQIAPVPEDKGLQVDYWDTWGRIHMDEDQYDKAEKDWNNLLDINAYNIHAWLQLCDTQFHLNKYNEALQSVEYLLAINGNVPEAIMAKGNCLYALNRFEEAIQSFRKYVEMCPDEPVGEMLLGTTLFCMNHTEEAYDHVMHMMKNISQMQEQNQYDAIRLGISVASKMHYYDDAMQYCDQLQDMDYPKFEVDLMRGAVLLDAQKVKDAMQLFADVVEASDFDPKIMIRVGVIFYEAGLLTSAYGMLNTVYEAYESCDYEGCTYDGLAYLAGTCRALGKKEEYDKYLRLAVKYAPLDASSVLGDYFPPGTEPKDYISSGK